MFLRIHSALIVHSLTIRMCFFFYFDDVMAVLGDLDSHSRLAHSHIGTFDLHGGRSIQDQAQRNDGSFRMDAGNQIPTETRRRNLLLPGISS